MTAKTQATHHDALIVGASLAGLRTAENLRRQGFAGTITVIGDEPHAPYNRPPLSKEGLTEDSTTPEELWERVALTRRKRVSGVHLNVGVRAVAADLTQQVVTLSHGEQLSYGVLVIATGLRPRRLHVPGPLSSRQTVRTLEDAFHLSAQLKRASHVVVIGSGFIGCEVASAARKLGRKTTLVEGRSGPMQYQLGEEVSSAVRDWMTVHGVQSMESQSVEGFQHDLKDPITHIQVSGGAQLSADVCIEAVGSVPNTDWLEGNGLNLDDGVLTDECLRVAHTHNVYAVGDIARFPFAPGLQETRRVEHWSTAVETAKIAAKNITTVADHTSTRGFIPNFWSDQFGTRLTGIGFLTDADSREVREGTLTRPEDGVVVDYYQHDKLIGALGWGVDPARMMTHRSRVIDQISSMPSWPAPPLTCQTPMRRRSLPH